MKKLTPELLKKLIKNEAKKFNEAFEAPKDVEKTKSVEIDADELGTDKALEKHIDMISALKIEESRLTTRLKSVRENKARLLNLISAKTLRSAKSNSMKLSLQQLKKLIKEELNNPGQFGYVHNTGNPITSFSEAEATVSNLIDFLQGINPEDITLHPGQSEDLVSQLESIHEQLLAWTEME